MASVVAVVLLTLVLSCWLLEPLVGALTPVLNLSWLGWVLLAALLWIFAGSGGSGDGDR